MPAAMAQWYALSCRLCIHGDVKDAACRKPLALVEREVKHDCRTRRDAFDFQLEILTVGFEHLSKLDSIL